MGDVGSDYADERTRRREERRRRRAQEKEQEEQEKSAITETSITTSSSFRSSHNTSPAIEVKLEISTQSSGEDNSKKAPQKSTGKEQFEDKSDINEAELKAEEMRLKREREKEERYQEQLEERRLTREENEQKQLELEERRERRRLKQLEEEERLKNEQEEREFRQAEEAKKLREEIQKRRQEAEERRNIQNSLGYIKPNYNILDSILQAEIEKDMSPEERAAQKAKTLEERVPPLDISPSTSEENLQDLALDLQAKLVKLYGATFDLLKRKQRQDYDLNELKSRITDMSEVSSPKKPIIVGTGLGHVSKIKEKGFFVEDKPVKKSFLQERNESIATSGGVQGRLSMFQRKVNQGGDQPDIRRSGRSAWKAPEYDKCCVCVKNVYTLERLEVSKKVYHQQCFRCQYCKKVTSLSDYAMFEGKVYCKTHQRKLARESLQHGQSPHN